MYPAKLLLFGEHLLLLGAPAVAMPVPAFGGQWAWGKADKPGSSLQAFSESGAMCAIENMDREIFARDVAAGLHFDSNIPRGYGLGSSGALCAAVYDRYAREKTTVLADLIAVFARMESFFHGHSSGIDPLTSYLRQPVLIEHKTEILLPALQAGSDRPIVLLLDSQLPRRTGPLVTWFLEQSKYPVWLNRLVKDLLPAHNSMVRSWLQGEFDVFWPALRQVSKFQFHHFQPMVPATLRELWGASLENENLAFKICGAGGGGFLLGFAKNQRVVAELQRIYSIVLPFEEPYGHPSSPQD